MNDNVRQLHPHLALPVEEAAIPSFSVEDFIENILSHTMYLIQDLEATEGSDEFRAKARAVQKDVAAWPLG